MTHFNIKISGNVMADFRSSDSAVAVSTKNLPGKLPPENCPRKCVPPKNCAPEKMVPWKIAVGQLPPDKVLY